MRKIDVAEFRVGLGPDVVWRTEQLSDQRIAENDDHMSVRRVSHEPLSQASIQQNQSPADQLNRKVFGQSTCLVPVSDI